MKRFVIETSNQAVIDSIKEWQQSDPAKNKKALITLISEYDKDKFAKQLSDIRESLRVLREQKISKDIMMAYIRSKGVSHATAKAVLEAQEEFFNKLGLM